MGDVTNNKKAPVFPGAYKSDRAVRASDARAFARQNGGFRVLRSRLWQLQMQLRPMYKNQPKKDYKMFYSTDLNQHGLAQDPFKVIVAPRPIGWITSMSLQGEINLAPYSYFNGVCSMPPIVCFSSEGRKDTLTFIEETKEFVCNLATYELRWAVNETSASYPRGVNEMIGAGLTPTESNFVGPPRIAQVPCALECKWLQTLSLRDIVGRPLDNHVVFGQVVGVYIDDRYINNNRLDTSALRPIARCGGNDYAVVDTVFSMVRPKTPATKLI